MEIPLHHVLATIYIFITVIFGEKTVSGSDRLHKQQISECHDNSGDCLAREGNGKTSNILLRLPRINGVKVLRQFIFLR